jgi:hypothetical protein
MKNIWRRRTTFKSDWRAFCKWRLSDHSSWCYSSNRKRKPGANTSNETIEKWRISEITINSFFRFIL